MLRSDISCSHRSLFCLHYLSILSFSFVFCYYIFLELYSLFCRRWCHMHIDLFRKLHQNTANTATAGDCCVFVRQIRHSYFAMEKEAGIYNPSWCNPWAILKFQLFDTTRQLDLVLFFYQCSTWSRQQLLNIIR